MEVYSPQLQLKAIGRQFKSAFDSMPTCCCIWYTFEKTLPLFNASYDTLVSYFPNVNNIS